MLSVNPFGFAKWFATRVMMPSPQFQMQVRDMRARVPVNDRIRAGTVFADADIDALPAPVSPLRDAPQVISLKLMKRFLNLRYANRSIKRPVSVYLSKCAVEVPLNSFGLCGQLEDLATELYRRMQFSLDTGRWPEERNPSFPEENFNDRWPKDVAAMKLFQRDLRHLLSQLNLARQSTLSEIQAIFDELFGERVSAKAVRGYADRLPAAAAASSYERGKGYVAAPALLAPSSASAAKVSRAPAHHFHLGRLRT